MTQRTTRIGSRTQRTQRRHKPASVRRDVGKPAPPEELDRKYRRGGYHFLDRIGELGHYSIVAGYIRQLCTHPSILDIGCGHGRLLDLLPADGYVRYQGVDLSGEAIRLARKRESPRIRFDIADFNTWRPAERYSAIIFSESLSYAHRPVATLRDFARALEDDGILLVSLYRYPKPGALWRRIWPNVDRQFEIVDHMTVSNRAGQTWDVKALRPRP